MKRFLAFAAAFGLACCLCLGVHPADAGTTLVLVQGSGEFQTFPASLTLEAQQALTLQWTTDLPGASGGTWTATNLATHQTQTGDAGAAPAPGHFSRFSLPAAAFLKPSVTATVVFQVSIQAHTAMNAPLGAPAMVTITEQPAGPPPPPINFGSGAVFPSVAIVSYDTNFGQVQGTQLQYATANLTLKISNTGSVKTDPMWMSLFDDNHLMRQDTPAVAIPVMAPHTSQTVSVHLTAQLPAPTSQLPEEVQYNTFYHAYDQACGPEFDAILDWRGPEAQAPVNDHADLVLKEVSGVDQPSQPICDAAECVSECQFAKNVENLLDGHVVGYSYFVGRVSRSGAGGWARTNADGGNTSFHANTKITVASVSKLVSAIATVRLLKNKGVSLDSPIGPFLPPDWKPGATVKAITFRQLLEQKSGIKDYGNVSQTYAQLQTFYTQSVSSTANQTCQGSKVINPPNPINASDHSYCYSNYNFAILRLLLPKVAGFAEDLNTGSRPQTYANQYVKLVQQNEFDLVGAPNVSCSAPGGNAIYAYAYLYPGSRSGTNWTDNSLICGAAGWYLTAEDLGKVMASLAAGDGRILPHTTTNDLWTTMKTQGLGFDAKFGRTGFPDPNVNYPEVEKNGGWSAQCDSNGNNCDTISTSVAVFGPGVVGIVFLNSNISGGPESGKGARNVVEDAYYNALKPKP